MFFLWFLKQIKYSTSYHFLSLWTQSRQGEGDIRAKGLQESAKRWWSERFELLVVEILFENVSPYRIQYYLESH